MTGIEAGKVAAPVRYNGRQVPSEEVEKEVAERLGPLLGTRLNDLVAGFTYYQRSQGAARGQAKLGDRDQVRRLVKELSPRWHDVQLSRRQQGIQRCLTYHDGLPPLRTLLLKAMAEDVRLDARTEDVHGEQDRLSLHWTYVMERFSEVTGQVGLRARVLLVLEAVEFHPTLDGLRAAMGEAHRAAFTVLAGDLAVLQFRATGQVWLLPEVKTLSNLCDALQRFGYHRLDPRRDPHNTSRRLELAMKDMAEDLVVVEFYDIDWRALLAAAKFTHAKNSGS